MKDLTDQEKLFYTAYQTLTYLIKLFTQKILTTPEDAVIGMAIAAGTLVSERDALCKAAEADGVDVNRILNDSK